MITLAGIIDEDFVNYRVPSMVLEFPYCSFKCGAEYCQNSLLADAANIEISEDTIYNRYKSNPITQAVVLQGLEPFDSWEDVKSLLFVFRIHNVCFDDIVIYTGYDKHEISDKIDYIKSMFSNVVVKYGRFIPDQSPHYDEVLGVKLASNNQYAERIN